MSALGRGTRVVILLHLRRECKMQWKQNHVVCTSRRMFFCPTRFNFTECKRSLSNSPSVCFCSVGRQTCQLWLCFCFFFLPFQNFLRRRFILKCQRIQTHSSKKCARQIRTAIRVNSCVFARHIFAFLNMQAQFWLPKVLCKSLKVSLQEAGIGSSSYERI